MTTFSRLGYTFRSFFDCDVDEMGHIDVEGVEVKDDMGIVIASVDWAEIEELYDMTDDELIEWVCEHEGEGI